MSRRPRLIIETPAQAGRLHASIAATQVEGHLLPRTLDEVERRVERFVVARRGRTIVGCAELAPLSPQLAEVRSLAVSPGARGAGVGTLIIDGLRRRARHAGFEKLCAFTHTPGYFTRIGFSIVPHLWLTTKVFSEWVRCPLLRRCGQYAQYAMMVPLDSWQKPALDTPLPAVQHA
jgi:amino-acid N-acetyltransferase